jgi:hypothetical protein
VNVNTLPAVVQLDISIFFTSLAWGLGLFLASRRIYLFQAVSIGCMVVLAGYTEVGLNMPSWLAVPALIPLDILLAWYVLRTPRKIAISYVSSWVFYVLFHVGLSFWFHGDWLIPAWKLHA